MLDGNILVDAHVHVPVLDTLRPAWLEWARDFGAPGLLEDVWDPAGVPRPDRLDALFEAQGVDVALLFCEYSPKTTGIQAFDDLLPIVETWLTTDFEGGRHARRVALIDREERR